MSFVGLHVEGWTVVADTAYCGFDGGTYGYPESHGRFWCRHVEAHAPWRNESDRHDLGHGCATMNGPDVAVVASLGKGAMRYDSDHVLNFLAKLIAPIEDAHQVAAERLRWAKDGHANWRLSADGTRGEWAGKGGLDPVA